MRGLDKLLSIGGNAFSLFGHSPYQSNNELTGFELSHIVSESHGTFSLHRDTSIRISDASEGTLKHTIQQIPQFKYHTDTDSVLESWRSAVLHHESSTLPDRADPKEWVVKSYPVPDVRDKQTVLTLAKLAANAYVATPHEGDWSEVNGTEPDGSWNHEGDGYGWDDDGLRGYVFTTPDKKAMVLSIKGTSTPVWNDGGPTAPNDKINDNLFFSCCCARVTRMWSTVCDCFLGNNQCDEVCLERELVREDRYYHELLEVFAKAKALAPEARIVWIVGHSLGGSLASMLGRTYGIPVVTFEAPGEDLPVRRLHLPVPPGIIPWEDYVWHFGHNADPIFMGTCSGSSSTCWLKGYAMETKCHSGKVCLYDTKGDLGWHDSIVNHRIHVVIDNVLEKYDEPASCLYPGPCEDCDEWDFIDPLDVPEPSTTISTTSSSSSSSSRTTTTTKSTSTKTTKPNTSSPLPTSTDGLTSSCLSRAWYGKCEEWTTYYESTTTTTPSSSCVRRNWLGQCELWSTHYMPQTAGYARPYIAPATSTI